MSEVEDRTASLLGAVLWGTLIMIIILYNRLMTEHQNRGKGI